MSIFRRKKQTDAETESLKSFLDMIAPSIVKFETGYYICGNTFRCIWALREYPTSTDDLAIPVSYTHLDVYKRQLQNMTVDGDLIIGCGAADGKITLDNVTVKGRLLVWGGGTKAV